MTPAPHDAPLDAPSAQRPHRLYFAVTNNCNRACPWCSVYSRPGLQTSLTLAQFCAALPTAGAFETQLEGGEPLLHPELFAMVDAAWASGRCKKIVLCTNGIRLPLAPAALETMLLRFGSPFTLKMSVNHHLYETDAHHLERVQRVAQVMLALRERGRDVSFVINLRRRRGGDDDAWLQEKLGALGLLAVTNDFFLQRYGFASDDEALDPPYLAGHDFTLFNPDGSAHGTDLIARSQAMKALP